MLVQGGGAAGVSKFGLLRLSGVQLLGRGVPNASYTGDTLRTDWILYALACSRKNQLVAARVGAPSRWIPRLAQSDGAGVRL